jgi:hypothetical protein
MKKWDTPVLSVLHRSTSAEKVLVICKHLNNTVALPAISFGGQCLTVVPTCSTCQGMNLS